MERTGTVAIGRALVRVPGWEADPGPTALRLRLSRLLGSADLRPAGLPPSAVLIVRRLSAYAPIALTVPSPGTRLDPVWERATRRSLDELARVAARPDRAPVPPNAVAVRFDGEAEL